MSPEIDAEALERRVTQLEHEKAVLEARLASLGSDAEFSQDLRLKFERRRTSLVQTAVVAQRLAACASRAEALEALVEVVVNLIGSERLLIFEIQGAERRAVASFGVDDSAPLPPPLEAALERSSKSGKLDFEPPSAVAVVPLGGAEAVRGAIVIFELLPQKPHLDAIDRDLLRVAGALAAMAFAATESVRG